MYVKDLVETTTWVPNKNKDDAPPLISVLLPTFEKAHNGFLKRVLDSIIAQSFSNFEVIIVDDASSDNSIDLIYHYMDLDCRIDLLRHSKNIGLPAISEWEAYEKSNGKYIVFAFDDNYFYPDAFKNLLDAINERTNVMCHGNANLITSGATIEIGSNITNKTLALSNYIANSSVILPRNIINDIGLYDPHILMTRNCDWDLWQRISRKYKIEHHNFLVVDEYGLVSKKSLGNSYPMDMWGNYFWRTRERNDSLHPSKFENLDVFYIPETLDGMTKKVIFDLSSSHAGKRNWISQDSDSGVVIVLFNEGDYPTVSHAFKFLPKELKERIRLANIETTSIYELARASCLIVVRQKSLYDNWVKIAKSLGIKVIYYVDDNFLILDSVVNPADYVVLKELKKLETYGDFDEIWCSTDELADAYKLFLPHKKVFVHGNSYQSIDYPFESFSHKRKDIVFGFFGGSHRLYSFINNVIPALHSHLSSSGRVIKFIIAGVDDKNKLFIRNKVDAKIELIFLPFELDWQVMMRNFNYLQCDYVIYPSSDSNNKLYKTDNALVCATYAGAILCTDEVGIYKEVINKNSCIPVSKWDEFFFNVIKTEGYDCQSIFSCAMDFIRNKPESRVVNMIRSFSASTSLCDYEKKISIISQGEDLYLRIKELESLVSLKDEYINEKQELLDKRYKMIVDLQHMLNHSHNISFIKILSNNLSSFLSRFKRD
ncbi:glycosyltransferase family 2 protein [Aeromonas veronii]